jgi:Helicase conserved C-terminal domain
MASTLTEHLRALPDGALAAVFSRRPDLLTPPPTDISALAARAQSRVSVARALDGLDLFSIEVLDAARLTRDPHDGDTTSLAAVLALTATAEADQVRAAVRQLEDLVILYGTDDALHIVAAVDEVSSPYPAGLGRPASQLDPAAAALAADPAALRRALLAVAPAGRAVLDRLAAGPPIGAASPETIKDVDTTVGSLVARSLLIAVADDTVELPREMAIALRRDGDLGPLHPFPPVGSGASRTAKVVDSAGTGQVMETVRHVEDLLSALSDDPAAVLRTGGLGVRDLRRIARTAGATEPAATVLLEVAAAAGLLGETDGSTYGGSGDPRFLPTLAYDQWIEATAAQRWIRLARAWLVMTRQPGLANRPGHASAATNGGAFAAGDAIAGTGATSGFGNAGPANGRSGSGVTSNGGLGAGVPSNGGSGSAPANGGSGGGRSGADRAPNVLSPELERTGAPRLRATVLELLASGGAGSTPTEDDLLAALHWRAPRRSPWQPGATDPSTADPVRWILAEAAQLGLTGLSGLTGYGRMLLDEVTAAASHDAEDDPLGLSSSSPAAPSRAAAALDKLLPPPVDHLLVQADLTVVVPGPPEPALAAELALVAEHESAGGASVYRVTPDSVRRALDAGHTAADLQNMFNRRSRTAVPQSLTYMIDDVARRHGGLRVGAAGCYLRSEDNALLIEVAADRRLSGLSLRSVAPTVLISPYLVSRVLDELRAAGYAPVQEDGGGGLVIARTRAFRAPPRRSTLSLPAFTDTGRGLTAPRLAAAVEALRRGDAAARSARRAPATLRTAGPSDSQAHTNAMAVLQQAVRDKASVWVGYVDAHGSTTSRLLRPVSIGGGYLRAQDERTDMLHTFALHRITAAVVDGER